MNSKLNDLVIKLKKKASISSDRTLSSSFGDEVEEEHSYNGSSLLSREYLPLVSSLSQLLTESSAMTYFMRFLESIDRIHYLKFWIHVQGFKSSSSSQLTTEALNIYNLYLSADSPNSLIVPEKLRLPENELSDWVDIAVFDNLQQFVWNELDLRYFKEFVESPFYSMHELEVFKLGVLQLDDILSNEDLLNLFVDFMDKESRRNLLEFVLAVDAFDADVATRAIPENVQLNALSIYERFVSMQAPQPLNFDNFIRIDCEGAICTESGVPRRRPFEKARQAAAAILETQYIPTFMRSKVFADFVDRLNYRVEVFVEEQTRRRAQCRREDSLSSPNSAPSDSSSAAPNVDSAHSFAEDDSLSLCSTGSTIASSAKVSHSPQSCCLARVDEMGRYESLFDSSICAATADEDLPQPANQRVRNALSRYLQRGTAASRLENPESYEAARSIVEDVRRMISAAEHSDGDSARRG